MHKRKTQMGDHQIPILEEHGYNSSIFLFGEANIHLMDWLRFNAGKIGGIVSKIHFNAPSFIGHIALISSETQTSASSTYPGSSFFNYLDRTPERNHVKSIVDVLSSLSNDTSPIEASFIGNGYHLDFFRGNFAVQNNDNIHKFSSLETSSTELKHRKISLDQPRSPKITSRINEVKYGIKISGATSLLVSVSENGSIIVVSDHQCSKIPTSMLVNQDGIQAFDMIGDTIFQVSSPELTQSIRTPLSAPLFFTTLDNNELLEWHQFN
jgi:hypothetical protein